MCTININVDDYYVEISFRSIYLKPSMLEYTNILPIHNVVI